MIKSNIFTADEIDFMINHSKGTGNVEMIKLLADKFGTKTTLVQLGAFRNRNNLNSGIDTKFKKGIASYRPPKGTRTSMNTEFKKGNVPVNTLPIGTELKRSDGYWQRKITNSPSPGMSRKSWKLIHHIIWEEKNGIIPKGHRVIFLDGNTDNLSIDNLMAIPASVAAAMSKMDLFTSDKDLTTTNVLIAKVIIAKNNRNMKFKIKK